MSRLRKVGRERAKGLDQMKALGRLAPDPDLPPLSSCVYSEVVSYRFTGQESGPVYERAVTYSSKVEWWELV